MREENPGKGWETQRQYALRVRGLWGAAPKKAYVRTYGCQQNVSDSEKLSGMLSEMGYVFTDSPKDADLVLFNTCAVREHAEQRVLGNVGALKGFKAKKPDMLIALCGCMMQERHVSEKIKQSYPYVDLVFGTGALPRFPELLWRALTENGRVFDLEEQNGVVEGVPVRRDGAYTAWLPVMNGCNNFCTYCIVPYVRGREHSRAPEQVLREAEELLAAGVKDLTLLGQNVNSYGKNLQNDWDFAKLLEKLAALPGEFRLHFMTSHPKDASHRLFDTIAANPKISRRLHLPFQSGSDRILRQMNRGYTAAQYRELVAYAKAAIPGLCLTSDVIVGFPGETCEDFKQTLALVEEVGFANLYTFLYSPRKGTPAAEMPDPVAREEKARWFEELLAAQGVKSRAFLESHVGMAGRVLAENVENGLAAGHTDSGVAVSFPAPAAGRFYEVSFTEVKGVTLLGEPKQVPVKENV
ncbi:RNA modification enzyme, MiaB family [Ethanoligenens harbinense YUAN-3]|uniref:tRNA-2-methylthio-N(6)-dimethylallyladenosine synthase n=1 Tax=Ethanoligenens harbinense (strain DSM 18485 / JCM 12961 / CGMCC 1.5033 / YUAN-3) TaxID=663278 RepID=E6U9Z2_ETHHY|nr:RNA modification enzyme, MiaB family [Ethanoligenens harbinense YUAN-3]